MSTTVISSARRVPLDLINVGENVRELDLKHVKSLASSIALRGLITPLVVRPGSNERFTLVAGHHRLAACRELGHEEVEITIREQEDSSADSAAENVVRKQLTPLEEARAIQCMLDEGYTLDGAAAILGWSRTLVTARAKILSLPETAQRLLGNGELPVSTVSILTKIMEVSREICETLLVSIADQKISGEQFARRPGWAVSNSLGDSKIFAAYLSTCRPHEIVELRLGKRAQGEYARAEQLHRKLDAYAYGPPTIRFCESDINQARAAAVLIEFEDEVPIITDRALYRELAKQAIKRTVGELQATVDAQGVEREARRGKGKEERTPEQQLEAEHRAAMRQFAVRGHGTNLDLGTSLLQNLAVVDPNDINVARFFAHGLLGPNNLDLGGGGDHTVAIIAANGIRLVIDEFRTTTTPRLKSGGLGKTKVVYGEIEDAAAWLWKFIAGTKNAGELYGRTLVVFAAQHYAQQLVLPTSKRRSSALPYSYNDTARIAFERVTKKVLPASHKELRRAIEREAHTHTERKQALLDNASEHNAA